MNFHCTGITENDQQNILHMFRAERDKQYDKILEGIYRWNQVEPEREEDRTRRSSYGLRRWLVEKLLQKCQDQMDKFMKLSHPEKSNISNRSNRKWLFHVQSNLVITV